MEGGSETSICNYHFAVMLSRHIALTRSRALFTTFKHPSDLMVRLRGRGGRARHFNSPRGTSTVASAAVIEEAPKMAHLTSVQFSSLGLSPLTQKALTDVLKFDYMTQVQEQTLPTILHGNDVLAKAKTGTGKTMGFLIPSVENLVRTPAKRGTIPVLVISPTRELASQIAKEAQYLLTYHNFKCQVVYGGTNVNSERNRLQGGCDILVATPGRLIDHLENSGLATSLKGIQTLILDEADQLLEMGFRPDIEKILRFLPTHRQTLLFSATLPSGVQQVAGLALRDGFKYIDTVGEDDTATNVQVDQYSAVVPLAKQFESIHAVLRNHMASSEDCKIIVFFVTARFTQYMAEMMNAAGDLGQVLEIHSRKSQSARDKASAAFRSSKRAILFSSDVSARGVDYPDITLVLQIGIPSSREQYIHRLGRTARAGKKGQGILMLSPFEEHFLRQAVKDLPLSPLPALEVTAADTAAIAKAVPRMNETIVGQAYGAWMGFYNSSKCPAFRDKAALVRTANEFATYMGALEPPALMKKTVGMMGLRGVPGIRVLEGSHGGNGGGGAGGRRPQQQQQQQRNDAKESPGRGGPSGGGGAAMRGGDRRGSFTGGRRGGGGGGGGGGRQHSRSSG